MPADPLFDRLARALAGRYSLIRELGQGGMATVYLSTDLKLARRVAIKVLAPATRAYLGSDRFQREVLLAAQLSHPNIVPLFEADEADGLLYYVMEYVEGESLQDRIVRKGPLPVDESVRLATEVGDALQYAHDCGVIHRDIKPANILLSRGHAMVSDFGIAKLMEDRGTKERSSLTGHGVAVGTAEYMSPEQAGGDKRVDPRSDVYGLAAVMYEMLAGEPPFTGDTVQAVVARVLNETPRPIRSIRSSVPAHLERALMQALAKRPGDRPPTARAFIEMLADPHPRRRLSPQQRLWLALGGSAAALALGWVLWPSATVRPPAGMTLVVSGAYPVGGSPWRESTTVRLDSFYIDSTEVTVAAYARRLAAARVATPWGSKPPDGLPVTGVLWSEAAAYCAARQSGGRLPTENEWEAAARGPKGLRYPWGDRWQAGRANADSLHGGLAPAGDALLGKSWVGAVDMIGNAWEWTATPGTGPQGVVGHVIKGGAFDTPPENATASFRAVLPDRRQWLAHTGFRCARDVTVQPVGTPSPSSVAVLYFDNQSSDTADAYLAVGLTEAIITRLGRVDRLSVKSRNAVRRFHGVQDDPAKVGRALGVAFLVSGGVRRTEGGGGGLHVTAELVRAASGVHVWGAQYNRGDTALQAIEVEITDAIATRITGELAPAERNAVVGRATRDPATYDHFLHGTYYLAERTPRAVARAIREFEAAERLDSGFAPAPARIALGYALFLDWGWDYPGLASGAVLARGFAAADRALRRDSASADAWMARGFLLSFRNPRTFAGVEDAFRHATTLDPLNAEAYHQYGMTLLWLGRDSAAADMYRRALNLDPERPITLFNLARLLMRRGEYRPAIRWLDSSLTFDPAADYAYVLRALAHLKLGDRAEARADGETAVRLGAGFRVPGEAVLVLTDLAAGDTAGARARLDRLARGVSSTGRPTVTDAAWVGRAFIALGQPSRALELLEQVRPRGARLWYYLQSPEFDAMKATPRFRRLVEESQPK